MSIAPETNRYIRVLDETRRSDIAELVSFVQTSLDAAAKKHALPISYQGLPLIEDDRNWDSPYFKVRMGHCDIDVNIRAYQELSRQRGKDYLCLAEIVLTGITKPFHDYEERRLNYSPPADSVKLDIHKNYPTAGAAYYEDDKRIFLRKLINTQRKSKL